MTGSVVAMIIIGLILIFASFFITEKFAKKEENVQKDFLTIDEDYEFSERELRIIKRKIEEVIARQAKDILYETNESLASMANEKTMALGDYAVTVCDEIEKNHKEAMFLYSMLDDKQKEIMNTVKVVDAANKKIADTVQRIEIQKEEMIREEVAKAEQPKKTATPKVNTQIKEEKQVPEMKAEEPEMNHFEAETEQETDLEDVFAEIDETEINFDEVLEEEFTENENSNDIILGMYRNGSNIIEIAKQLGLGVGEVKLVIDLYQGE